MSKVYFVRQLTSFYRSSDTKNINGEPQVNYKDMDGELHSKKKDAENERFTKLYELIKNLANVGKIDVNIESIMNLKGMLKNNIDYHWSNEIDKSMELLYNNNRMKLMYTTAHTVATYEYLVEEIEEENIFYVFAKQNFTHRNFKPEALSVLGTNYDEMQEAIEFIETNDNERMYCDYTLQIIDKTDENTFNKLLYLCCEKVFTGDFHPAILDIFNKDSVHDMKDKIRSAFLREYNEMKRENNRLHYEKMMLNGKIQELEAEIHGLKYPEDLIKQTKENYLFEKPRDFKSFENGKYMIPF